MNTLKSNNRICSSFLYKTFSITTLVLSFAIQANAKAIDLNNVIVENRPVTEKSELKPHVGLLTGLATPEGSYRSSTEYGVTIGYQPYIPFAVGLELSTTDNNTSEGREALDLRRTKFLVQGTYNFGGGVPVISKSYVGIAVGPMLESINSKDNLVIGTMPTVGFDYPFMLENGKNVSMGVNARYLVSSSSVPNTFSLNAMAKYWF